MDLKLVIISDTHNQHYKLDIPDGDILIHCGDYSNRGIKHEHDVFIDWFSEQPHKHKILVAGNHDIYIEQQDKDIIAEELLEKGIFYLEESLVAINGVVFWGNPYTPTFYDWAFMLDRHAMRLKMAEILDTVDILVNHGMPYGTMDIAPRINASVGCIDLKATIQRVKPKLVCGGHLHSGHGVEQKDGVLYVNASVCTENYAPINKPQVIHYDSETKHCWGEI